ncbi:kinetochore complex Sim4 subunit Fta1-domain-containing protein [Ustulina deusta]|nr:kinetochore complex Sim4 subunit Fta1-domain-containing protein [Ustulina deusta]
MPRTKRGRPATAAAQQPEPEPVADDEGDTNDNASDQTDRDQNSGSDSDPDVGQTEAESTDFKFFNATFSTFRVSPLYVGQNALTPTGLETLSRRLRDTLVGDVVRGVQVGLESGDATLGRLGVLERVEWRECRLGTILPTLADAERRTQDEARKRPRGIQAGRGRERGGGGGKGKGIQAERVRHLLCLELEYEKATFSALMLPSLDARNGKQSWGETGDEDEDEDESPRPQNPPSWTRNSANPKGKPRDGGKEAEDDDKSSAFAHFPLLLTRMPAPLKSVLVDFLSSIFDCRISPLYLGTRTLIRSWECWMEESGVGTGKVLNKDVALTLGFHLEPSPTATDTKRTSLAPDQHQNPHGPKKPLVSGLRAIDVVVPSEEVGRFLRVGKRSITDSMNADNGKSKLGSRKRPADTTDQEKERLRRRRLGGGKDEEGWAWRESPRQQDPDRDDQLDDDDGIDTFAQPFTNALSHYLDRHLALDVTHPGVRVLRVVCDAFALSETRMKVFAPRGGGGKGGNTDPTSIAIDTFLRNLIRRAQGREWGDGALRLANLRVIA